ncbi:MAG: hypothetical protein KKB38_20355 [Gammaproteobacteria bacterium]|nr:hypothetical protein [Gammaproteobacteria bacterium]
MICPLRDITVVKADEKLTPVHGDCLEEECAWWSKKSAHCVVVACMEAHDKLVTTLQNITQAATLSAGSRR